MTNATTAAAQELTEKNEVIAHLTQTLAHTRNCLEIARAALANIAEASEDQARSRAIAVSALR
jgi:hypothetical protein